MPITEEIASIASVVILESYYGGSHKQLIEQILELQSEGELRIDVFTLPAKKWKWRLRCGAAWMMNLVPQEHKYEVLFCSSMLNLAELVGIRRDLQALHKIIYFHENQLNYPARYEKDTDFQLGWIQIMSCLAADEILFNSSYNMNSFLTSIDKFLKKMPSFRPQGLDQLIRPKSRVLYFPVYLPPPRNNIKTGPIHILWNHRWEYDKRPDLFFDALFQLQQLQLPFVVSVLGEHFEKVPEVFETAKPQLSSHIKRWGYAQSKSDYFAALNEADIVVSTTDHEFFGVSIIEAISQGCYPLCPNRLVFPEYLSSEHLYNTHAQLVKRLRYYAKYPNKLRALQWQIELSRFDWKTLKDEYKSLFTRNKEASLSQ